MKDLQDAYRLSPEEIYSTLQGHIQSSQLAELRATNDRLRWWHVEESPADPHDSPASRDDRHTMQQICDHNLQLYLAARISRLVYECQSTDLRRMKAECARHRRDSEQSNQRCAELRGALERVDSERKNERKEDHLRTEQLHRDLQTAQDEVEQLRKDLEKVAREYQVLEKRYGQLTDCSRNDKIEYERICAEHENTKKEHATLLKEHDQMKSSYDQMRSKCQLFCANLEMTRKEASELRPILTGRDTLLAELHEDRRLLEVSSQASLAKLQTVVSECEQLKSEQRILQEKVALSAQQSEQHERLKRKFDELNGVHEKLVADKASVDRTTARLKGMISQLRRKAKKVQRERNHELNCLKRQVADRNRENAAMQETIKRLHDRPCFSLPILEDVAAGHEYPPQILRLCLQLSLYSRAGYEFLQSNIRCIPVLRTIHRHFEGRLAELREALRDIKALPAELQKIIRRNDKYGRGVCLAVDAMSCSNTFVGARSITKNEDEAYAFLVQLQPLHPDAKCVPLFLIPARHGNANGEIQATVDQISEEVAAVMPVIMIASDGDSGYNARHELFFTAWVDIFNRPTGNLEVVLSQLGNYSAPFPVGDPLHLSKNSRSRLLKYTLTIATSWRICPVDVGVLRTVLHLEAPLCDTSQLGKMRDFYPLMVYRIENVEQLFNDGKFPEAVALLPMTLLLCALRLENVSIGARMDMLRLAFFLVFLMNQNYDKPQNRAEAPIERGGSGIRVKFLAQKSLVRFSNTVLVIMYAMKEWPTALALDRISTHPVENFFGLLRRALHDINTFKAIVKTVAKMRVGRECAEVERDPEVVQKIATRTNIAGVKLGPDLASRARLSQPRFSLRIPCPDLNARLILDHCQFVPGELSESEHCTFIDFLHYVAELSKFVQRSNIANEMRRRFIPTSNSRIITLLKAHNAQPEVPTNTE